MTRPESAGPAGPAGPDDPTVPRRGARESRRTGATPAPRTGRVAPSGRTRPTRPIRPTSDVQPGSADSPDDPTLNRRSRGAVPSERNLQVSGADTQGDRQMGITARASQSAAPITRAAISRDSGPGVGRFAVRQELGRGGVGVVSAAHDPELRREVAVKVLLDARPEDVAAFLEEAQITGQLEHPNIVPVYDLGRDDRRQPWLAMKLVRGRTLRQIIADCKSSGAHSTLGDLQTDGRLEILQKVCDAIAFAHSRGVIHRDLKPENIMVGEFGEVLVMDWGLARAIGHQDTNPSHQPVSTSRRDTGGQMTMVGDVFGTPSYMPPEQADGRTDDVDERSDVFAVGAILYAMLVFEPPYSGRNVQTILARAARRDCLPPRRRAPGNRIPRELDAITMKAMAADPADRYATASELKADIGRYLGNLSITARRDGLAARAIKWVRRHPTSAMASALLVMFGLVGGMLWINQQAAVERAQLVAELEKQRYAGLQENVREIVQQRRDVACQRWLDGYASRRTGMSEAEYFRRMGRDQVDEMIRDFERVLTAGEKASAIYYDDQDYFYLGTLYAFGVNKPAVALPYFDQALALKESVSARANRAEVRVLLGDMEGALADYDKALELGGESAQLLSNRAIVLQKAGRHEAARADVDRAMVLDTTAWRAVQTSGELYLAAGKLQDAIREYDRALKLRPDYSLALSGRARARMLSGDMDGALEDADRALQLEDSAALRETRATVRSRLGDHQGALDDYQREDALDPGNPATHHNMALELEALGRMEEAMREYNRALELKPTQVDSLLNRGVVRAQNGQTAEALADFDAVLAIDSRNCAALCNRAYVWETRQQFDRATTDYNRALDINPDHANARNGRALIRYRAGDLDGALEDSNVAVRNAPDNIQYLVNRGAIHSKRTEHRAAIVDFEAALRINPDIWMAWANIGAAKSELQDRAGAIEALREAWTRCPDANMRSRLAQSIASLGGDPPR